MERPARRARRDRGEQRLGERQVAGARRRVGDGGEARDVVAGERGGVREHARRVGEPVVITSTSASTCAEARAGEHAVAPARPRQLPAGGAAPRLLERVVRRRQRRRRRVEVELVDVAHDALGCGVVVARAQQRHRRLGARRVGARADRRGVPRAQQPLGGDALLFVVAVARHHRGAGEPQLGRALRDRRHVVRRVGAVTGGVLGGDPAQRPQRADEAGLDRRRLHAAVGVQPAGRRGSARPAVPRSGAIIASTCAGVALAPRRRSRARGRRARRRRVRRGRGTWPRAPAAARRRSSRAAGAGPTATRWSRARARRASPASRPADASAGRRRWRRRRRHAPSRSRPRPGSR